MQAENCGFRLQNGSSTGRDRPMVVFARGEPVEKRNYTLAFFLRRKLFADQFTLERIHDQKTSKQENLLNAFFFAQLYQHLIRYQHSWRSQKALSLPFSGSRGPTNPSGGSALLFSNHEQKLCYITNRKKKASTL